MNKRWLGMLLFAFSSCFLGPSYEKNDKDVEDAGIEGVSLGLCDDVPVLSVESLFVEPYQLSDQLPAPGARVAFEGKPQGGLICTQLGCNFECCDNSCGYSEDCPFSLEAADGFNRLCLQHKSFACGGTDCSPWCVPFSTEPAHAYRFVGTVEVGSGLANIHLKVESFCRL